MLLDGKDIRDDLIAFKRRLGYVPEEAILYSYLTGLEYLQLMGCLRGMPPRGGGAQGQRSAAALPTAFVPPRADLRLFKGMKQRILISGRAAA